MPGHLTAACVLADLAVRPLGRWRMGWGVCAQQSLMPGSLPCGAPIPWPMENPFPSAQAAQGTLLGWQREGSLRRRLSFPVSTYSGAEKDPDWKYAMRVWCRLYADLCKVQLWTCCLPTWVLPMAPVTHRKNCNHLMIAARWGLKPNWAMKRRKQNVKMGTIQWKRRCWWCSRKGMTKQRSPRWVRRGGEGGLRRRNTSCVVTSWKVEDVE